jgi:hypothetical protein
MYNTIQAVKEREGDHFVQACVVDLDPDPVTSELLAGFGSGKNHSGSGQLRVRNEFEVKTTLKNL